VKKAPPDTHSWPKVDGERAVKAVRAEDYIRRLVDSAPPLTAEQRDRLATILKPSRVDGPTA
jgi:hypothetical protein